MLVDAFPDAIDPAETESYVYGFGPGHTGPARIALIEAYPQFRRDLGAFG